MASWAEYIAQNIGSYAFIIQNGIKGLATPIYNVVGYGADPTGTLDSTAAIQAAVAAAGSGGIVFFPPGTYNVSGTIWLNTPFSGILMGSGVNVTFINATSPTGDIFVTNSNALPVTFRDMTFTAPSLRTGGYAINRQQTPALLTVERCDFLNQYNCINASGILDVLRDVNINIYGNNAIYINGGGQILDNVVVNYSTCVTPTGTAIFVASTGSLILSNCDLMWANVGLYLNGGAPNGIYSIYAINSFFDNCTFGMIIDGASEVSRCTFDQCWFSSAKDTGVRIANTSASSAGLSFNNCHIFFAANQGILASSFAGNWEVTNCEIGANVSGVGAGISLAPAASNFLISDNIIGACGGSLAFDYGIYLTPGSYAGPYPLITNNKFIGNTTPIADAPQPGVIIKNNPGYNPVGWIASPSVPTSASAYTNNYGVTCRVFVSGGTVSAIAINGVVTGLTSGQIILDPGETITLTYSSSPSWKWFGL